MSDNTKPTIIILSSVIGYGVYFPALIIAKQLTALGYAVEIFVIEEFLLPEYFEVFKSTRNAFRANNRLAQLASQLPISYSTKIDRVKLDRIISKWQMQGVKNILCFSGLWVELFIHFTGTFESIKIDCCKVDAGESKTWDSVRKSSAAINKIYSFFDTVNGRINFILNIPQLPVEKFSTRGKAVTLHGGGWDLGNFKDKTEQLLVENYEINLVYNRIDQNNDDLPQRKIYYNDQNWDPLFDRCFPDFYLFGQKNKINKQQVLTYPAILNLIAKSKCIISKPGGMTLMDSLICETPLIFLEPVGSNEIGNMEFWINSGLGVKFSEWEKICYSIEILDELNYNIVTVKKDLRPFVTQYVLDITTNQYAT